MKGENIPKNQYKSHDDWYSTILDKYNNIVLDLNVFTNISKHTSGYYSISLISKHVCILQLKSLMEPWFFSGTTRDGPMTFYLPG